MRMMTMTMMLMVCEGDCGDLIATAVVAADGVMVVVASLEPPLLLLLLMV